MREPTYRALLMGNATFDDPEVFDLNGPRCDLPLLKGALTSDDTGLFKEQDVMLQPDLELDEMGTQIKRFFDAGRREDLLLLYYSGHGRLDERGELCLFAKNTLRSQTSCGAACRPGRSIRP